MPYPLVLVHGFASFDTLIPKAEYWSFIPKLLVQKGRAVLEADLNWAGSVDKRGSELTQQIKKFLGGTGHEKVNIIAHSMGGLDARKSIVEDGIAPQVASLTTLGTPHCGTPFADWAVRHRSSDSLLVFLNNLGIDVTGLLDLTTNACLKRNNDYEMLETRNQAGILYQTYAGSQDFSDVFWPLLPSFRIIHATAGPNDGLVHIASAKWREPYYKGEKDWDHLNFLGWWDPAELDLFGKGKTKSRFEAEVAEFYEELGDSLP